MAGTLSATPAIKIKHGVRIEHLTPQALFGAMIVANVMHSYGYEFVLTSGAEGVHKPGSLHPLGRAFDFRTRNITEGLRGTIMTAVRNALGPEFDVVVESDHAHVEWDPDYLKGVKA